MYNILVCKNGLIKDYNYDFILLSDCIIRPTHDDVATMIYTDLSAADCNVFRVEDEIVGFIGNKFMYVDGVVSINPEYVEV